MIPDEIVCIDAIPRTLNGKIDKKSLPPIKRKNKNIKAPHSFEEKILYDTFCEILGIKELSIDENFFSIGGNSLKAIAVMSNLKNKGFSISVREILKYRTVEMLALHMKNDSIEQPEGTEKNI